MDYATAITLLEEGDLIAVHGTGPTAFITRAVTRSPVTHTGIATWMDGEWWMSELNGGHNHPVAMAQLENMDFDVHAPPSGIDRAKIRAAVRANLRKKVRYSLPAFVLIGLLDLLRLDLFVHWRAELVCSGYSTRDYENAGCPERSRIASPRSLAASLPLKFQVRASEKSDEPVSETAQTASLR
jgi:hypothetical protein